MAIEGKLNRDTGGFLSQNTRSISNKSIIFVIISFAKYDHFWSDLLVTSRYNNKGVSPPSISTESIYLQTPQQRIGEELVAVHKRIPWQIS